MCCALLIQPESPNVASIIISHKDERLFVFLRKIMMFIITMIKLSSLISYMYWWIANLKLRQQFLGALHNLHFNAPKHYIDPKKKKHLFDSCYL